MSQWSLAPTALLRDPAPPVFLHPRHWPWGCWACGRLELWHTPESRVPYAAPRPSKAPFRFNPDAPNLGNLRDQMAAAHIDHGDLRLGLPERVQIEADAAHDRWHDAMMVAHDHSGWSNVDDIAIARGIARPWPRKGSPK
jgi:hypothetical protein